jgi:dTDP-4-dehydrorhamnose reductase
MPTKVLLTGASGFLGWNICKEKNPLYELVGTYFRNQPADIDIQWARINLLETPEISKLIKEVQPDIVVHLAAIANAAFCEEHPALSHHINVYTTIALAEATKLQGIPMIFTSTDLVFNGSSAPYEEDDFCYPLSQYGLQKQMAEETLLADFEHVVIARFPLMFGLTPNYTQNFFTTSLSQLKKGETVNAFTDEYRTMISAEVASEWLNHLIPYCLDTERSKRESVFHLGGSERCSRYNFAIKITKVFNLDPNLVIPTLQKELDLIPARPPDVSLISSLANKILSYNPPSLDEQLLELKKNVTNSQ